MPRNSQNCCRIILNLRAPAAERKSGKALLKKHGTQIERGFAHIHACGGLRSTMLRNVANINKRPLCGIPAFNFSLIMKTPMRVGTPRQEAAAFLDFYMACIGLSASVIRHLTLKIRWSGMISTLEPVI